MSWDVNKYTSLYVLSIVCQRCCSWNHSSKFSIKSVALPSHNLFFSKILSSVGARKNRAHKLFFISIFIRRKGHSLEKWLNGFFFVIKRAIFVVENHHTIKLILQINRSNTVIWTTEWKEATITKHPISFATKSQNISLTLCPLFRKRWDLEGGSGLARDVLNF